MYSLGVKVVWCYTLKVPHRWPWCPPAPQTSQSSPPPPPRSSHPKNSLPLPPRLPPPKTRPILFWSCAATWRDPPTISNEINFQVHKCLCHKLYGYGCFVKMFESFPCIRKSYGYVWAHWTIYVTKDGRTHLKSLHCVAFSRQLSDWI